MRGVRRLPRTCPNGAGGASVGGALKAADPFEATSVLAIYPTRDDVRQRKQQCVRMVAHGRSRAMTGGFGARASRRDESALQATLVICAIPLW